MTEKILFVEDEQDLGSLIKQYLETKGFDIDWYDNPKNALKAFRENSSNYGLCLLDVQMPQKSGFELAENIVKIKEHIPFVFLTARTEKKDRLTGLNIGAADYISKPFDSQLLTARVASLLRSRTNLQKYFYNEITLHKSNLKISPEYKEFLEKCITIVESHLEDENFTVKNLLAEMGMSHSNLFRKVKSISGLSVNVFIRFIRLRKAAELFVSTDYNVNETAFMVGIKDAKYFREQFNKLFKMNPSEYIKKYRGVYRNQFTVNKPKN